MIFITQIIEAINAVKSIDYLNSKKLPYWILVTSWTDEHYFPATTLQYKKQNCSTDWIIVNT